MQKYTLNTIVLQNYSKILFVKLFVFSVRKFLKYCWYDFNTNQSIFILLELKVILKVHVWWREPTILHIE